MTGNSALHTAPLWTSSHRDKRSSLHDVQCPSSNFSSCVGHCCSTNARIYYI